MQPMTAPESEQAQTPDGLTPEQSGAATAQGRQVFIGAVCAYVATPQSSSLTPGEVRPTLLETSRTLRQAIDELRDYDFQSPIDPLITPLIDGLVAIEGIVASAASESSEQAALSRYQSELEEFGPSEVADAFGDAREALAVRFEVSPEEVGEACLD